MSHLRRKHRPGLSVSASALSGQSAGWLWPTLGYDHESTNKLSNYLQSKLDLQSMVGGFYCFSFKTVFVNSK